MITFTCCFIALVVGYFVYGKFAERIIGVNPQLKTPAYTMQDGVDYIPMPTWKVFMIQFLNIAGLGPIFGAILGAKFGTSSFLWIVLGSIFAGGVHDFFSAMLSLRHGGESLPELIGRYLGNSAKLFMRGFTVVLMVLVGAVFVAGPAGLLASLTPEVLDTSFWIIVVFIYYLLATLLPIDKIIGRFYPLFALFLLGVTLALMAFMLFDGRPLYPNLSLSNQHPQDYGCYAEVAHAVARGRIGIDKRRGVPAGVPFRGIVVDDFVRQHNHCRNIAYWILARYGADHCDSRAYRNLRGDNTGVENDFLLACRGA